MEIVLASYYPDIYMGAEENHKRLLFSVCWPIFEAFMCRIEVKNFTVGANLPILLIRIKYIGLMEL
jgi:hypothetical protein